MLWSDRQSNSQGALSRRLDSNMLPLINIIFLLLAFFVLAGQIEAHQKKLTVPRSISEVAQDSTSPVLTVLKDGTLELDGREIEPRQLRDALNLGEMRSDGSVSPAVLVVADGELLVSILQETLDELMQAGFSKINLATLQSKGISR